MTENENVTITAHIELTEAERQALLLVDQARTALDAVCEERQDSVGVMVSVNQWVTALEDYVYGGAARRAFGITTGAGRGTD